jgi:hypothetical protein
VCGIAGTPGLDQDVAPVASLPAARVSARPAGPGCTHTAVIETGFDPDMNGAVMDVIVDIRLGSPTFARWEAVHLSSQNQRGVFISAELGHAFTGLSASATLIYLCSTPYAPTFEHAVNPSDPAIGITWPGRTRTILSDRDAATTALDAVARSGLLPSQIAFDAHVAGLCRPSGVPDTRGAGP